MCDPVTAVIVANSAITVGGAIANHVAQNKASDNNRDEANKSSESDLSQLGLRGMQERMSTLSSINDVERQVQQSKASLAVSAGEAGVSGASVNALLSLVELKGGQAVSDLNTNFQMTQEQIAAEARGVGANRLSRINAVPKASWLETGLKVSGAGLQAANGINSNTPIKTGGE
jgi:hypothetical protein